MNFIPQKRKSREFCLLLRSQDWPCWFSISAVVLFLTADSRLERPLHPASQLFDPVGVGTCLRPPHPVVHFGRREEWEGQAVWRFSITSIRLETEDEEPGFVADPDLRHFEPTVNLDGGIGFVAVNGFDGQIGWGVRLQ